MITVDHRNKVHRLKINTPLAARFMNGGRIMIDVPRREAAMSELQASLRTTG